MNRLQKKCVIGTVGVHLLLLLILIVGPAFFNRQPKNEDTTVLTEIPSNLVDAALNSGVQNPQQPPPTPQTPITPQDLRPPPPIQTPPKVVEPPPTPALTPTPSLLQKFKEMFAPKPTPTVTPDVKPVERPKPHQDNIQVNLNKVSHTTPKNTSKPDNSQNINKVLKNLNHSLSSSTVVDMPGTSSTSSANYKDALATIYYNAWNTPDNAISGAPITKVKITVAADGTVLNSEIITPSGDASTDESVRQALGRVSSVPPLPDQSKTQQEFIIDFNLQTKRMLE